MNVAAYIRVSTDGQVGEDKFGIEAQMEQITAYCSLKGHNVVKWFKDEGVSGVKEERPALDEILYGDVQNPPYEAIVVAKSDRVARDMQLYFYFKMILAKKNVQLISVSDDFASMGMYASLLEAFTLFVAQMERENIAKRTTGGRKVKAAQGGYSGGKAPFGYKVSDGKLVINGDEAPTVRRIFALREQRVPIREIAHTLNLEGYKTRSGKEFIHTAVQKILDNRKTYEGMYKYGDGDWVKGQHEAIL